MQMITSKASVTFGTTKPPVTNGKIQVTDNTLKFTTGRKDREVLAVDADDVRNVDTTKGSVKSMIRWMLTVGVAPLGAMLARGSRQGLSGTAALAIIAGFAVFFAFVVVLSARKERVRVAFSTDDGRVQEAFFLLPKKTKEAALRKLEALAA